MKTICKIKQSQISKKIHTLNHIQLLICGCHIIIWKNFLSSRPTVFSYISLLYAHSTNEHTPLCCKKKPTWLYDEKENAQNMFWEIWSELQTKSHNGILEFIALRLWSPKLLLFYVLFRNVCLRTEIDLDFSAFSNSKFKAQAF